MIKVLFTPYSLKNPCSIAADWKFQVRNSTDEKQMNHEVTRPFSLFKYSRDVEALLTFPFSFLFTPSSLCDRFIGGLIEQRGGRAREVPICIQPLFLLLVPSPSSEQSLGLGHCPSPSTSTHTHITNEKSWKDEHLGENKIPIWHLKEMSESESQDPRMKSYCITQLEIFKLSFVFVRQFRLGSMVKGLSRTQGS